MRRISVFDLVDSTNIDDFKEYAFDRDAPNTHVGGNSPTRVFTVKVEDTNPDFVNERFLLRFNLIDQQFKHFRIRADLSTEDAKVTPALDSYKVKLGG